MLLYVQIKLCGAGRWLVLFHPRFAINTISSPTSGLDLRDALSECRNM